MSNEHDENGSTETHPYNPYARVTVVLYHVHSTAETASPLPILLTCPLVAGVVTLYTVHELLLHAAAVSVAQTSPQGRASEESGKERLWECS